MPVYLNHMPAGIPGDVTRKSVAVIETVVLADKIDFGKPCQLDDNGQATAEIKNDRPIYGFLVREYPSQEGLDLPKTGCVLRSGYIVVQLSKAEGAKPKKGMKVRLVYTASGGFEVGDIAVTQGEEVDGCTFMGEPDGKGNVEIAFNI